MLTREQILTELRRVAEELGRTPGRVAFENETGIRESDWAGKLWGRWSDAVREAGLEPNQRQGRLDDEALARLLALEVRALGRFPATVDLKMRARQVDAFPSHNTFRRWGGKAGMVEAVRALCETAPSDWEDVLALLPAPGPDEPTAVRPSATPAPVQVRGFVYLVRSGRRYKIGFSTDVQRRLLQLNAGMPDTGELVHVISTDDPAGIEAYWHRRFADKRVRPDAEWFDLTVEDVTAFRRRKFQ